MDSKQIERARTALDDMGDFARMSCGVDAFGPRKVLVEFISSVEAATQAVADERAEFEAFNGPHYLIRKNAPGDDTDGYQNPNVDKAWKAWKARAARSPAPAAQGDAKEEIEKLLKSSQLHSILQKVDDARNTDDFGKRARAAFEELCEWIYEYRIDAAIAAALPKAGA